VIDEIKDDTETRMEKSVAALETAFARIRTGRASPALLDDIKIDYYGTPTPLNQVASVTVEESRALLISPWEKKLVPQIERAILKSDLGLTPNATADVIRLPMPPLTEETRRDLGKQARAEAEHARVSVRNVRRDSNSQIKELLKEKVISEDDARRAEETIQKITDRFIAEVDKRLESKEADLLEI